MIMPVQKAIGAYKDNMDYQNHHSQMANMTKQAVKDKPSSNESRFEFANLLKKTMERADSQTQKRQR